MSKEDLRRFKNIFREEDEVHEQMEDCKEGDIQSIFTKPSSNMINTCLLFEQCDSVESPLVDDDVVQRVNYLNQCNLHQLEIYDDAQQMLTARGQSIIDSDEERQDGKEEEKSSPKWSTISMYPNKPSLEYQNDLSLCQNDFDLYPQICQTPRDAKIKIASDLNAPKKLFFNEPRFQESQLQSSTTDLFQNIGIQEYQQYASNNQEKKDKVVDSIMSFAPSKYKEEIEQSNHEDEQQKIEEIKQHKTDVKSSIPQIFQSINIQCITPSACPIPPPPPPPIGIFTKKLQSNYIKVNCIEINSQSNQLNQQSLFKDITKLPVLSSQTLRKQLNQNFHKDLTKPTTKSNKLNQSIDKNFNPCNAYSIDFDKTSPDQSSLFISNILDSKLPIHRIAAITGTLKRLSLDPSEISNIIQGNFNNIDQIFDLLHPDATDRLNLIKGILPLDSQVEMLDKSLAEYLQNQKLEQYKQKSMVLKGLQHFIDLVGRVQNRFEIINGMIAIEGCDVQFNQFRKIVQLWEQGISIVEGNSKKIAIILSALTDICSLMNNSKAKMEIHIESWLSVFMIKSKKANSKSVLGDIILNNLINDMKHQKNQLSLFNMSESKVLKSLSAIIHSSVFDNLDEMLLEFDKNILNLKNLVDINSNCLITYFTDGHEYLNQEVEVLRNKRDELKLKIDKLNNYFEITTGQEQTNYIFKKIVEFNICVQSRLDLIKDPNASSIISTRNKPPSSSCFNHHDDTHSFKDKKEQSDENSIFYNSENKQNLFEVSNQCGIFRNRVKRKALKTQYFLMNSNFCDC